MKVEKNEFLASIVSDKKGSEYDVAVMYSGGKDSSYMLLLLKEVYNLRVLAVMVDNGFEYEGCVDDAGFFLNKNNIDYHVICPDKNIMECRNWRNKSGIDWVFRCWGHRVLLIRK